MTFPETERNVDVKTRNLSIHRLNKSGLRLRLRLRYRKGLKIDIDKVIRESPLAPLYQRGVIPPFSKGTDQDGMP